MSVRVGFALLGLGALAACVPGTASNKPDIPEGPKIEIVQAVRAADTTRVTMRYKSGDAIPLEAGLLTVNVFCIAVRTSDQVIDGSGLRT